MTYATNETLKPDEDIFSSHDHVGTSKGIGEYDNSLSSKLGLAPPSMGQAHGRHWS